MAVLEAAPGLRGTGSNGMALDKPQIARLYRKRAKHYNLTANLYYVFGFREQKYREMAVNELALKDGDTVVEIGCGTGINFPLFQQKVGSGGRVIGVDLTPEMLDQARMRAEHEGWKNVELIQSDAARYLFPESVDGVISSFAITLVPEYDAVIKAVAASLSPGKRIVILDFKKPSNWPEWLLHFWLFITKPFGVTLDLAERHPWESIERHMKLVSFREIYFGSVYIAVGEAVRSVGGTSCT